VKQSIEPGELSQAFFNEKYRLLIVSHSRCFSKSMNVWFGRMIGYEWPTFDQWYFHSNISNDPKLSLRRLEPEYIAEKFSEYRVYFFIRNPYERFYSHILAHLQYEDQTFYEASRKAIFDLGIMPGSLLNDVSRKVLFNLRPEFVEFHHIPQKLGEIRRALDIEIDFQNEYAGREYEHSDLVLWPGARDVPLREISKTDPKEKVHIVPPYRAVYDEDTADLVYSTYRADFQYFNYSKNFRIRDALLV